MTETLEVILEPTGKIRLIGGKLPDHPVKAKVTIQEEITESVSEKEDVGDYLLQLENYEDLLAKGGIKWR